MTFAAYIECEGNRIEATTTESPRIAREAYRELLDRGDYLGANAIAVLERDAVRLCASDFAAPLGRGRIHPEAPLDVYAAPIDAVRLANWRPAHV